MVIRYLLENISLFFGKKIIVVLLFFFFFRVSLMPAILISQDSITVKKADSTEITRPLPKWLLDQKKNQTAKNEQPSDIFKSKNYFLFSVWITVILLLLVVASVSTFIIKRSRRLQ